MSKVRVLQECPLQFCCALISFVPPNTELETQVASQSFAREWEGHLTLWAVTSLSGRSPYGYIRFSHKTEKLGQG